MNKKECELVLENKNLVFKVNGQKIAYLVSGECFVNRFKNKLIFFKKDEHDEPIIIFELQGEIIFEDEIKRWIKKRNHSVVFRSPLVCDYNSNVRESLLSKTKDVPDLRGFTNAFIVLGLLSYGRLMIDHFLDNGTFFLENSAKIWKEITTIHFMVYSVLFFIFAVIIYYLQNMTFKKLITEKQLNIVLVVVHLVYLLTSIFVVYYFKIPFAMTIFMNLYTFVFFLKGLSYCHVLNTVRFY